MLMMCMAVLLMKVRC